MCAEMRRNLLEEEISQLMAYQMQLDDELEEAQVEELLKIKREEFFCIQPFEYSETYRIFNFVEHPKLKEVVDVTFDEKALFNL